jgi:hypothetical protein
MSLLTGSDRAPNLVAVALRFRAALIRSLRHNAGVILLIVIAVAAGIAAAGNLEIPPAEAITAYIPLYMEMMPVAIAALLFTHAIYIVVAIRPKRPVQLFLAHLRDYFFTVDRIAFALPVLIVIPLFGGAFTVIKSSIPSINPFSWDPFFYELDKAIHFGTSPWELIQPIVGHPFISWAINWFYNLWFFVLSYVWVWQAFSLKRPVLRLRFFYSMLLTWIFLGIIAAIAFSSVGPCFYGRVVSGPSPYADLMRYLYEADKTFPIWALDGQAYLWNNFTFREVKLAAGISAMPSMHIAMSFLFFLVGRATAPWIGRVFLVYLVIMLLGSVHLGWHYAIDGYVSIAGVCLIWWIAGKIARRAPPYETSAAPQR